MFSETDKKVLQVVLVIAVVAAIGLFYYVYAFVNKEKGQLNKTITDNTQAYGDKSKELAELQKWKEREGDIQAIVAQLEEKVKRLPTEVEPRKFYDILSSCIRMTNLSVNKIVRVKAEPMGAYSEIPYLISGRARYHDLGQFLMLVEQHRDLIMRIKTLDIRNDVKRPSRHPVTLRVATFVFTQPLPRSKEVASK